MQRIYTVEMENGQVYGVPAEVIADNYANYYKEQHGEDYTENFNAMIHWFDTDNYDFADWATGNMDWDDVKDKAVLIADDCSEPDYQDGWINGPHEYKTLREDKKICSQ